MTVQCEGMGEVGSARYEPALLPPCPSIRALSYSNCQRPTHSKYGLGSVVLMIVVNSNMKQKDFLFLSSFICPQWSIHIGYGSNCKSDILISNATSLYEI